MLFCSLLDAWFALFFSLCLFRFFTTVNTWLTRSFNIWSLSEPSGLCFVFFCGNIFAVGAPRSSGLLAGTHPPRRERSVFLVLLGLAFFLGCCPPRSAPFWSGVPCYASPSSLVGAPFRKPTPAGCACVLRPARYARAPPGRRCSCVPRRCFSNIR